MISNVNSVLLREAPVSGGGSHSDAPVPPDPESGASLAAESRGDSLSHSPYSGLPPVHHDSAVSASLFYLLTWQPLPQSENGRHFLIESLRIEWIKSGYIVCKSSLDFITLAWAPYSYHRERGEQILLPELCEFSNHRWIDASFTFVFN